MGLKPEPWGKWEEPGESQESQDKLQPQEGRWELVETQESAELV